MLADMPLADPRELPINLPRHGRAIPYARADHGAVHFYCCQLSLESFYLASYDFQLIFVLLEKPIYRSKMTMGAAEIFQNASMMAGKSLIIHT